MLLQAERAEWKPDPTVCTGDKWPQHTCTLKYNMTGVKVYGGDQAGGALQGQEVHV